LSSPVSVKVVRWKGWGLWRGGFKEKVSFEFRVERSRSVLYCLYCTTIDDNCWAEHRTSVRQTVLSILSRDKNSNKNNSDARRTFMSLSEYFHQRNDACLRIRSPHYVILTSLAITGPLLCSQRWECAQGDFSLVRLFVNGTVSLIMYVDNICNSIAYIIKLSFTVLINVFFLSSVKYTL